MYLGFFAGQWNQLETRDSWQSCTLSKTQPSRESAYCQKERATFLRKNIRKQCQKTYGYRVFQTGWSKGTADNTSTQRNAVIRELGTLRSSIKLKESKHLSRFKSRRTFYSWHCLALTSHWFVTQHLFVTQQGDLGTLSLTWNCKCTIDPFSRKSGFESENGAELQISVLINRRTSGKTVC